MIAIIDYDAGNLRNVENALHRIGQETKITRDRKELLKADKVILPGVGSFGDAMNKLSSYDLIGPIHEVIHSKKPFLGICLGMQLLFSGSAESEGVRGLGILDGDIKRIPNKDGLKIPHIGWNSLDIKPEAKLYEGISNNSYVYFVHSYYLEAKYENEVIVKTEYGVTIHASIHKDNIYGCQFHPEKSGEVGLKILSNFATL